MCDSGWTPMVKCQEDADECMGFIESRNVCVSWPAVCF
jgi:hypothetical protein